MRLLPLLKLVEKLGKLRQGPAPPPVRPAPVRAAASIRIRPASFYQEDWGIFGLDQSDDACAGLFSVMAGTALSPAEVADGSYLDQLQPISAADWVTADSPATVVAYGTHDKMQPFLASLRLKSALEEYSVDHKYFELSHSGHGLQNDNKIYKQWMDAVEEYLDVYLPVE